MRVLGTIYALLRYAMSEPLTRPAFFISEGSEKRGLIWRNDMLNLAVTFLVIALIAALFGFTTIVGTALEAAKILCFVFLVLAVVSLIMRRRTPELL